MTQQVEEGRIAGFPVQNPAWELDSIFPGGADSAAFRDAVDALSGELDALSTQLETLASLAEDEGLDEAALGAWVEFLEAVEALSARSSEAGSWAECVAVTNTNDARALRLPTRLNDVRTRFGALWVAIEARFRTVSDTVFTQLTAHARLARCELFLRELRRDARQKMDPALEDLAVALNRDGLHSWGQLYDQVSGSIQVEVALGDEVKTMSVGQAKNLMSDADRTVRKAAYDALQTAWGAQTTTLATTLNSIIGAERTLYLRRGQDELSDPLHKNRVERATVEAMFEAAAGFQDVLVEYMQLKARLLGVDRLAWYDLLAPLGEAREEKISYAEAQEFIVAQAQKFSPKMSRFYQQALVNRWVEVEDRPGKGQGGFCTGMPVSKQIRIFMTFGGTSSGVQTLAHELGHAWHGWLMRDLGSFERNIPMTLAETASTLSEALVESAALRQAEGAAKLRLLDERLERAVAFLIDIPARYNLERAMHAARAAGELDADTLAELTRESFGRHYGAGVSHVDPTFWASKLHFFITELPFYNFPYTFGYLFSRAVYDRAQAEGPGYADVVDQMLIDTGHYTAEEIARRYLDADLSDPGFWRAAAMSVHDDLAEFKRLI